MEYRAISHSTHGNIKQGTLLMDIATHNVIRLAPADSVGEAARIMAGKRISSIVVTDADGHPVGIVTERNMLSAMQSGCPPETALKQVMSAPVVTVPESMTCLDAYQIFLRDGIRHLVIVNADKRLLGMVSETDFRLHINLSALAGHRQVVSVMSRSMFSLSPEAGLQDALDLMQSHRDSCVVVVEAERPVGIITERDIVRLYSGNSEHAGIPVRELMSSPVLTIPLDSTINEAAERMLTAKVRHLVVVDCAGRTVGLLSEHDLTRTIALNLIDGKLMAEGAFLHTLVNTIPDLIWLKDAEGVYLACNPRFENFFGAQEKDIVGKTDYDFVDKELADCFRLHDRNAMEKDGPSVNEEWVTFADGGHRELLETLKTPMRGSDGKLIGVLGIARDITVRKKAEEFLHLSELKYRSLVHNIPDIVWTTDQNGKTAFISDNVATIFGYTAQEIYADPHLWLKNIHADDIGRVSQAFTDLFTTNRPFDVEYRIRRKGGEWLWLRDRSVVSYEKDGTRYADGVFTDITARKQAELEREQYFKFFNTSSDLMCIADPNGCFIKINPAGPHMLGYSEAELLARPFIEFIHPDDRQSTVAEVAKQLQSGFSLDFENRYLCKDGSILWLSWRASVNFDEGLIYATARDISGRKQMESALAESEHRYRTLIENSPLCIHEIDLEGRLQSMNRAGLEMLELDDESKICGIPYLDAVSEQDSGRIKALLQDAINGTASHFEFAAAGDAPLYFKSCFIPIRDSGGKVLELMGLTEDITKRKRAEENLRITASVFDNSQEGIVITDADNVITDVNPAFTLITGYSREEVLGQNPKLLSSGRQDKAFYAAMWQSLEQKKAWRGEVWDRRKSGEFYAELLSISAICGDNGKVQRYVGVFSDISYLKAHEAELSRVAHYDALTGIPNRMLLADRMRQAIAQTARDQNMVAVCYLDLDSFKTVNDTMGHEVGDQVLIEVAKRIGRAIRSGDTVARLGGDEFVVLLLGLEKGEECVMILERLLTAIAQPMALNDQPYTLSASIGVSIYPLDDEDPDSLLRHADQAMYAAKQSGKNRFYIYDPELDLRARHHHELLKSIRSGLELGQFELYYQPKINLSTKQLVGAEALIRWRHPERGLLSPVEFLCSIERTELDIKIGDWVIVDALAQIQHWQHAGLDIEISINISAYHLESPGFAENLRRLLESHPGIPPGRLQIEVLESTALNDIAIVREVIEACRKFGVRFALDDFGTGYSSLSHLSSLPVDVLKIDQSFVRDMLEDKGDLAIIQGIIALAQAFGYQTVAEGIEIVEHYRELLDMGCEVGQGYCIARPMPADELINWQAE